MSLKVKEYHDCVKPDMLVEEIKTEITTGQFWWKKTRVHTFKKYQEAEAHYTCDSCKSEWRWSPGFDFYGNDNEGSWISYKRTHTWKKV